MGCEVGIRPVSSKESIKTAYLHLTTIGKHQVTEDGVCDGLNGHWDDAYLIKLNNCAITCANGDAVSGAGAIVKRAEEGDGAERRSGAATSEMRNAWGDVPGAMAARGEERR